ncbi:hypothetical protein [Rhizobium tumorigenes]|uniref:Uncharacterized protein n=1 Tax=Rhizobium tumorigenes TaxID=2041385 RepID=A0AAF1KW21_9HYPH|nr:hypothetical protein [Rhizobium tumorigenes]WFR97616.1 hypothetical protein PR017_20685 [Rhizobium tumorigenes]
MNTISIERLEHNQSYWARRLPVEGMPAFYPNGMEIVQVSTVFGAASEFWTVAVIGSDEHVDLASFEFFPKVPAPPSSLEQRSNLKLVSSVSLTGNQ